MIIKERYDKETGAFAYDCVTRIIQVLGIIKITVLGCISVIEIIIIILSVMFNIIDPDIGNHAYIYKEIKQRKMLITRLKSQD